MKLSAAMRGSFIMALREDDPIYWMDRGGSWFNPI
jgi:hypothetical protein